jgi:hypothetical protein
MTCVCNSPYFVQPIVTPLLPWQTDFSIAEEMYADSPEMDVNCQIVQGTGLPVTKWRHKDSDGVVLAESQMNIPQATSPPQFLENSTHMRVRNDENTKIMMERVFNGIVGDFFFTEEKE